MKKLIIFLSLIICFFSINIFVSSDYEWNTMKNGSGEYYQYNTNDGDIIYFEKRTSLYEYRVTINKEIYVNLEMLKNKIAFLKFYETYSYYFFYGSVYRNYETNVNNTLPYIIRIDKEFNKVSYILKSDSTIMNYNRFFDMYEYGKDSILVTELYDATYDSYYVGNYRLDYINQNLEIIKELECGHNECTISIAYDTIDIKNALGEHYYFDKNFNMVDTYKKEMEYNGYIEFETDCYVDDILYEAGSILSYPGVYILSDKIHDNRTIKIYPLIEINGEKENDYYTDYIEYKVTGGITYINDELVSNNGIISKPGKYTIIVNGKGELKVEKEFKLAPRLYTNITNGDDIKVGETIDFIGDAKLNGTVISSGYRIDDSGDYTLELFLDDEIIKTINFSVSDENIKKDNKKTVIIIMIIIASVLLIGLTVYLIISIKRKKKDYLIDDEEY